MIITRTMNAARLIPASSAILLILVMALGFSPSLSAHSIDPTTSFYELDRSADMVIGAYALTEREQRTAKIEATYALDVIDVFRAPEGLALTAGARLRVELPFAGVMEASVKRGSACLFFLRRSPFDESETDQAEAVEWEVVLGEYLADTLSKSEAEESQSYRFLGESVGRAEIEEALSAHAQLAGKDAVARARFHAMQLKLDLPADQIEFVPLADQRIQLYRRWLGIPFEAGEVGSVAHTLIRRADESGEAFEQRCNDPAHAAREHRAVFEDAFLLQISALYDAYQLAQDYAPLDAAQDARFIPDAMRRSFQEIALFALKHRNRHLRNAAITIIERVGTSQAMLEPLAKICDAAAEDNLLIARKEAHRYLGACEGVGEDHLFILLNSLDDDSLRDQQADYPALGISACAAKSRPLQRSVMEWARERIGSDDWYAREAALRALQALGTGEAYRMIHAAYEQEPKGELRDLMLEPLLRWDSEEARLLQERVVLKSLETGERQVAAFQVFSYLFQSLYFYLRRGEQLIEQMAELITPESALYDLWLVARFHAGDSEGVMELMDRIAAGKADSTGLWMLWRDQPRRDEINVHGFSIMCRPDVVDADAFFLSWLVGLDPFLLSEEQRHVLSTLIEQSEQKSEEFSAARLVYIDLVRLALNDAPSDAEIVVALNALGELSLQTAEDVLRATNFRKLREIGFHERLTKVEFVSLPLRYAAIQYTHESIAPPKPELLDNLLEDAKPEDWLAQGSEASLPAEALHHQAGAEKLRGMAKLLADTSPAGQARAGKITRILSNLVQQGFGYCSVASLSELSMRELSLRWQRWFDACGDKLAWDEDQRRFVVQDE